MSKVLKKRTFSTQFYQAVEDKYNAKFVCESCLKNKNGSWANFPAAFFYTEEPHPASNSHYFAVYRDPFSEQWIITNGQIIAETIIEGVQANNGDIIYSRFRYDFFYSPDDSIFVDGGRDYTRFGGSEVSYDRVVKLVVKNGELIVASESESPGKDNS